jgi:hypothetical protein
MTDTGQELAVKKQNIDAYTGATKGNAGASTKSSDDSGRSKADWEYVHPPSGRQYTMGSRKTSRKSGRRKRSTK